MKGIYKIFIGAFALLAAACSDDQPDNMEINIPGNSSGSEVSLDVLGGSSTIDFEATSDWTAEVSEAKADNWLTVYPTSGGAGKGSITITVQPFDVYSSPNGSRIGYVTLTCGSFTKSIAIVQSNPEAAEEKNKEENAKIRRRGGELVVEVPAHAIGYTVEVADPWISVTSQETGSFTLKFDENPTAESRAAEVKVMSAGGDAEIINVNVEQSWRDVEPGEILIEEIYFTGTPLPSTGKTNTRNVDQYFLLTNNTDELLYADRLLIIESKNANAGSTYKEFKEPIVEQYCEAGIVMCVPGNGTDVPLQPGESLIIASNGINYKEGYSGNKNTTVEINPDGIDLSKANFEWFTQTTNSTMDVDVPEVPNMDIWFAYTLSILNLNDRGFQSYAIAQAPITMTKESFLADYNWAGAEYINHTLAGDFDQALTLAYKVPNEWVIDAVACTVPSIQRTRQFSERLDAGWTYASPQNIDQDAQRYGHSVLRKRGEDGKLVDTNNSSNDFTPNSTPSLRGK
ncbi:MAG: DUF4876 domain-containing protein [Clostridium sp.]|nr:DUF4876 domain-containing protein [Clostridium sp.]